MQNYDIPNSHFEGAAPQKSAFDQTEKIILFRR